MKTIIFVLLLLTFAITAHSQEVYNNYVTVNGPEDLNEEDTEEQEIPDEEESDEEEAEEEEEESDEEPEEQIVHIEEEPEEQESFAWKRIIRDRTFELGLANANVNVSNNNIKLMDLFQETVELNLETALSGIKLDADASIKTLSFYYTKDRWGVGLDIGHINIYGNMSFSDNLLDGLAEAKDDKFGIGAAVFADIIGIPFFFYIPDLNIGNMQVNNLKVRIRPAVFVPIFHTIPGIVYNRSGGEMSIDYDMRIYSIVNMESITEGSSNDSNEVAINKSLGFDFSLGFEYPLLSQLDLGVDIVNIPFIGGKLNYYMHLKDSIYFNISGVTLDDLIDGKISEGAYHAPDSFDPEYGNETVKLYRPFKTVFYANYRPLNSPLLTLIPSLGFSRIDLYPQKWGFEGGVSTRLDIGNLFITTLGFNYNDRKWKNSLDFSLNFRFFQLDIGASLQSPNFAKSFQGAGFGFNAGLKFGW
ncbi:MAG: hypothetical protein FWG89_01085 [Treponema sp.]|nr:hypothetical protein [Treponema sp.]